jgi:putative ATP-binding cassette transporter
MILAVFVTQWTAGLFNALEVHSITGIIQQILSLILLFAGSIGINTAHTKMKRNLQIGLRSWLTENTIDKWMMNDSFYKLAINPTDENDNPDGRIADDIRNSADGIINLFDSLLLALLSLASFTGILWGLSGTVVVFGVTISGYMVWLALLYAAIASGFGYYFSKPLTATTNDMCTAEQNFRFELVETKTNCGKISLQGTQPDEVSKLLTFIKTLKEKYNIQTKAWMKIVQFHSGYGISSMAFPIIAAAPLYIAEKVTLGGLMQASQSFSQVVSALSWPVNHMAGIALWRTSVERVLQLVDSIDALA